MYNYDGTTGGDVDFKYPRLFGLVTVHLVAPDRRQETSPTVRDDDTSESYKPAFSGQTHIDRSSMKRGKRASCVSHRVHRHTSIECMYTRNTETKRE